MITKYVKTCASALLCTFCRVYYRGANIQSAGREDLFQISGAVLLQSHKTQLPCQPN